MLKFPKLTLFEKEGRFTQELERRPGAFGLGQLPKDEVPDEVRSSICGYCSTGCNLKIHLKNGIAQNLTPDLDYPVNLGMACPKGWEALSPLRASDRALTPLCRSSRSEAARPISWSEATQIFCDRIKAVQAKHGAESVAFLSTGQICTEEMAMLGAFAKFGMGCLHGDGNTRQCMATSVVAYKQAFGFDAPPFSYADFEQSEVLVFFGANPCIAHPILWQRVLRNPHAPKIIVIDPRRTETAMAATWHLPLQPKSDLILCYGLANILFEKNWIDREFLAAHTDDWEAYRNFVRAFNPDVVTAATGFSEEDLIALAQSICCGKRVSFWWTMGVNQGHEATRTAQAIINLALLGGHIGKPGTGANSITGQCNAMGSRLFSNTTNLLGGHDFSNPAHREKIAAATGLPVEVIPQQPSAAYDQIFDQIAEGRIKALWIIATNPAHSWINQTRARETLQKLDFLVVQDMYHSTDTAQLADLILPAAGWGEKTGTFINSERRISLVKPVCKPPGEAKPDFDIFRLLVDAWGCGHLFKDWHSPEAVFQILKRCSADQPCDIRGITDYAMLESQGGVQWPCLSGDRPLEKERRLFANGQFFTPNGRAKLVFSNPGPIPEPPDSEYSYTLLTGRGSSAQWHTETRTRHSEMLRKLHPSELAVEINPSDALREGISPMQWVRVASRRGSVVARAKLTATVQVGHVFLPMHHGDVNKLTFPSFDTHSRQPSYKACAVRLVALAQV